MIKVKKITEIETNNRIEKEFIIELSNKSQSSISIIYDFEVKEWALQGDSEQRFSADELKAIARKLSILNKKKPRR